MRTAPMGMMGDHTHNKGEFMFTYRYMYMSMDGMWNVTDRLANSEVLQRFTVTPTDMTMNMHMFMPMYGLNDTVTVMGMIPYAAKSMDHLTRPGGRFTTESDGIGDVQVIGLVRLYAIETPSTLKQLRIVRLGCDRHEFMQTWLYVVDNPYFAITGSDGTLEIGDIPPGRYDLTAWHPELGMRTTSVTVTEAQQLPVLFDLSSDQRS